MEISPERLEELLALHKLAGAPPTELGKVLGDLHDARTEIANLSAYLNLARQTLEGVRVTVECRYANELAYVDAMVRIGIVVNKVLEHLK